MPLNVLKIPQIASTEQLIRLFHQSQLEWARHLGEEIELDFGRWIPNAGCLLEARLLHGKTALDLIAAMAENGRDWTCCSISPSSSNEQIAELSDALVAVGWIARPLKIYLRRKQAAQPATDQNGVKIIPARASFRHYRQLMQQRAAIDIELGLLHLDDSHFDVLLGLKNGLPVGSIGVLTSGEVGTIREWFVASEYQNQGIDGLLLDRALEICTRGMLKHVMIGLPDSAEGTTQLCQTAGFEPIGQWLSFWKESCKSSGLFA